VTTPLARRLAGEAGIDLNTIKGSGPRGRIVAADIETARKSSAPAQTQAVANIVVAADVGVGAARALCADVPAIELADVFVKAWAMALRRVTAEHSDVAIAFGQSRSVIRDAASQSLSSISAARRNLGSGRDASASTAISIPGVPGIASVADVLQPPQTTMLGVGAPRRAPVEAADGSVTFVDMMTVTLTCDPRVVGAALGAELLSAFKHLVEQPVMMIV
jgi:pyruvate dehydrogenase E2 component (dihydrolipoamide acetyltransferase)